MRTHCISSTVWIFYEFSRCHPSSLVKEKTTIETINPFFLSVLAMFATGAAAVRGGERVETADSGKSSVAA